MDIPDGFIKELIVGLLQDAWEHSRPTKVAIERLEEMMEEYEVPSELQPILAGWMMEHDMEENE